MLKVVWMAATTALKSVAEKVDWKDIQMVENLDILKENKLVAQWALWKVGKKVMWKDLLLVARLVEWSAKL